MIKASIITIGDEILVGQTIDTNSAWIANQLNSLGIPVIEIISISDNEPSITEALDRELSKADLVFVTGGLGPTQDDITKKTMCHYFGDMLEIKPEILRKIELMFEAAKRPMLEVNRLQAHLPKSAIIIENDLGTASGMWFQRGEKSVISLPGVPYEMKGLVQKIIPMLQEKYAVGKFYHQTILFQGIGESLLADSIEETETACRNAGLGVAYLPSPGIVKLRLTGTLEQKQFIEETLQKLAKQFPDHVFGFGDDTLEKTIGISLRKNKRTLATVESCTGGAIAARIVSVAGSSDYFQGSIVSYSNEVKKQLVHVQSETLDKHGAVSQETVEEMAKGGRIKLKADYCIAVSGIAGPDGGSDTKPVGTIWIALASERAVVSKQFLFKHNRERNIELTVVYALNYLRRSLENEVI